MKRPFICPSNISIFVVLALLSTASFAAIDNAGLLDNVLLRYSAVATTWNVAITNRATWLFWTLVIISMVWTFGMMAMRKADLGEFYAEFVRFTIFEGFFWWLLVNGPVFSISIINSLRQIAGEATGLSTSLSPSGIVDVGFDIFFKVLDQSSVWSPADSTCGVIIGAIILVVFALVGVNMLLLLISAWILAYAGVFFLGFGGSRWTSEMAIGYYRTVLNIAAQLFTMVLLVGIGKSFVDQYYVAMNAGISLKELGVMLVVAVLLLALVKTIPGLIGGLAGGNTGSLGSGFGAGAALGAAALGAAALGVAGAAVAAGAASAGGGAQALMAAFSKANASESAGGGGSAALSAAAGGTSNGDGGSVGSGSALAAAMGDGDAGATSMASSGTSSPSESTSSGSSSSSAETGSSPQSGIPEDALESATGPESTASSPPIGSSGASSAEGAAKTAADETVSGEQGSGTDEAATASEKSSGGAAGHAISMAGTIAAKVGRVAAGTAMNLAQGSWDVGKSKAAEMQSNFMDRVGETTGGKIASAIKARAAAEDASSHTKQFDENSISAGSEPVDAAAEIAAFRDGKSDSA